MGIDKWCKCSEIFLCHNGTKIAGWRDVPDEELERLRMPLAPELKERTTGTAFSHEDEKRLSRSTLELISPVM